MRYNGRNYCMAWHLTYSGMFRSSWASCGTRRRGILAADTRQCRAPHMLSVHAWSPPTLRVWLRKGGGLRSRAIGLPWSLCPASGLYSIIESLQTTDNFLEGSTEHQDDFSRAQVPVIVTTNRSVVCKFARVGPKLFCYLKEEQGYNKKCLERNRDYHHLNGEWPQWAPNLLSNIHWHAIFHMTQLRMNPLHPVILVKPRVNETRSLK